jgi:hypothetical protein
VNSYLNRYVTRVPQLGQNIAVPGIWKPQTPHCFTTGVLEGGGA